MYGLKLERKAVRELGRLTPKVRKKIANKLDFYIQLENPLVFAKKLKDFKAGQYRFRVGDYRIVFDVIEKTIRVMRIGHRREIYK